MSNNLPKVYASCRAGCNWETVHRSEVEDIIIALQEVEAGTDGRWLLEKGVTYKIKDFCAEGQTDWAFSVKIARCVAATEWGVDSDGTKYVTGEIIDSHFDAIVIPLAEYNGFDNFVKFRFKGMEIVAGDDYVGYVVNLYYDLNGIAQTKRLDLNGVGDATLPSLPWPYEIVDIYVEGAKKVYTYTDDLALVGLREKLYRHSLCLRGWNYYGEDFEIYKDIYSHDSTPLSFLIETNEEYTDDILPTINEVLNGKVGTGVTGTYTRTDGHSYITVHRANIHPTYANRIVFNGLCYDYEVGDLMYIGENVTLSELELIELTDTVTEV